jgi:hypothetical protein
MTTTTTTTTANKQHPAPILNYPLFYHGNPVLYYILDGTSKNYALNIPTSYLVRVKKENRALVFTIEHSCGPSICYDSEAGAKDVNAVISKLYLHEITEKPIETIEIDDIYYLVKWICFEHTNTLNPCFVGESEKAIELMKEYMKKNMRKRITRA